MEIRQVSALVTGASSGLGFATAAALAACGARVFGVDLQSAIDTNESVPDWLTLVAADVTDEDDVRRALRLIGDSTDQPLRIVVNCAGIGPSARILSNMGPHDLELFRTVISVNLLGTFNVLRLAAETVAQTEPAADRQRGVIVNTASVAAFEGQIGQVAYAASKGGVHAITVPAARDLAQYGIRVNTIAPGIVDTPMLATVGSEIRASLASGVPFPKRLARAEEFADLVVAIIEHDYLNGETIRMDGGLRMAPR